MSSPQGQYPPQQQQQQYPPQQGYPQQGAPQVYPGGAVVMMQAPPQQSMDGPTIDTNRARPIFFGSLGGGASRLLHHGYAHPVGAPCMHNFRGICNSWTAACTGATNKELTKNRYVQIWDNKVVINEPSSYMAAQGCCDSVVFDAVSTIYLDDPIVGHAVKAGFCSPCCINTDPFPDCCGYYGETLIFHTPRPPCCCGPSNMCDCGSCRSATVGSYIFQSNSGCPIAMYALQPGQKTVYGLENVQGIIDALERAKAARGIHHQYRTLIDKLNAPKL